MDWSLQTLCDWLARTRLFSCCSDSDTGFQCNECKRLDRAPKVGMFRDGEGRISSLSREEFGRLRDGLPLHVADMSQFSVATGLRQANVTRLQWKQISMERRHLWVAGNEHKNGRPHSVPLNDPALHVLQRRQGDNPSCVFTYGGNPSSRSTPKPGATHLSGLRFSIFGGMIFITPLPHRIGKLELPLMNCNALGVKSTIHGGKICAF